MWWPESFQVKNIPLISTIPCWNYYSIRSLDIIFLEKSLISLLKLCYKILYFLLWYKYQAAYKFTWAFVVKRTGTYDLQKVKTSVTINPETPDVTEPSLSLSYEIKFSSGFNYCWLPSFTKFYTKHWISSFILFTVMKFKCGINAKNYLCWPTTVLKLWKLCHK